jgi:serine/threonine-protein kinase RsbW
MDTESSFRIAAELKNLSIIRRFVRETTTALGADPDAISDVILAVDEAATNSIVHGYQGQPGIIEIKVRRMGDSLVVCLRDQATSFDPAIVPSPDLTLPLEQRPFGGMGVYMMRQLMDKVTHRVTLQGDNELTMVKKDVM